MKYLFIFFVSLIFSSCGINHKKIDYPQLDYEKLQQDLNRAKVCCKSFKDFTYIKAYPANEFSFSIDSSADTYSFQVGKSFFKAFLLEKSLTSVKLKSFHSFSNTPKSSLFSPIIILLDKNHSVTRYIYPSFHETVDYWGRDYLKYYFERKNHEKYMIIHTNPDLLDKFYQMYKKRKSFNMYFLGGAPVYSGFEHSTNFLKIRYAAGGYLQIITE